MNTLRDYGFDPTKEGQMSAPYSYSMVLIEHAATQHWPTRQQWHQIASHVIDEISRPLGKVIEVRPL